MSAPAAQALPSAVLLELPSSPAAVERDLETLPPPPAAPWWREHGWSVPAGLALLSIAYRWLAGHQGWDVPGWLAAATAVLVALTAAGSLVAYVAQLRAHRAARGRAALLAAPVRTTGTLHLSTDPTVTRGGVVLTGTVTYSRVLDPAGGVPLVSTARFTRTVPEADGAAVVDALPRRRVVEPVALWYAEHPDTQDVVLVRYARRWADEVLGSLEDDGPTGRD